MAKHNDDIPIENVRRTVPRSLYVASKSKSKDIGLVIRRPVPIARIWIRRIVLQPL